MSMVYVAVATAAVSLIGTGLSATAQYQAGQSAQEAANYNAEMERRAATDALQRGANDAADVKQRARRLISTQVAAAGSSGFDASTGTNLELSTEAAGFGELDALKTINNAQRQASGANAQAELDLFQGKSAANAGAYNAAGTVFSGLGNATTSFFGTKGMKFGASSAKEV